MTETERPVVEPTVDEQVALMYLGSVDEAKAQELSKHMINSLAVGENRPKNADVLYAFILLLSSSMRRMGGTVAFRQTILRGFGDVAAGQLELMSRPPPEDGEADAPPEEERKPPKPYTELATGDDDVYTVADFKQAVSDGAFTDDDGHGRQACKLGADLVYYSKEKKHVVSPSDFSGPDEKPLLPGTSHVVWFNK